MQYGRLWHVKVWKPTTFQNSNFHIKVAHHYRFIKYKALQIVVLSGLDHHSVRAPRMD